MQTDRQPADRPTIEHVLNLIPSTTVLLTSAFGELRSGVIVTCVQQVAMNPPMVLVAMEKGQPLSPVIRDSRNFAICLMEKDDRATRKTFATAPDQGVDPFLTIPHLVAPGGSPVPTRCTGFIACELIRHLDIEADYEVYIGMVHAAAALEKEQLRPVRIASPRNHLIGRTSGTKRAVARVRKGSKRR